MKEILIDSTTISGVQQIIDNLDYIVSELENGESLENQDIQFLKDLKDKVFSGLLSRILQV